MKKTKLKVEYEYDFGLLGISSLTRPFKLAWQLNSELKIQLIRKPDISVVNKNNEYCSYAFFEYETLLTTIRLFKNKPNEPDSPKWVLVPEHPQFDFILMFKGESDELGKRLQKTLRDKISVELVAFLPLAALKSKDNFIF